MAEKRIGQHGLQMLEALAPHVDSLKGESHQWEAERDALQERVEAAVASSALKVMSGAPEREEDLTAEEHEVFVVLREWKRARGRELGYNNPCGMYPEP